jgi:hypothetical protein
MGAHNVEQGPGERRFVKKIIDRDRENDVKR